MNGHPLHCDFGTASLCGNGYQVHETDTARARRESRASAVHEHATLEEVTDGLYKAEYQEWIDGGRTGREPKRLTRERTRQVIKGAMAKCEAYCRRNRLNLSDLLPRY